MTAPNRKVTIIFILEIKTIKIPREFKELLLSKIDIVDLIESRVPVRKKSGANFFACCPFHQEKTPSFSVNQQKQFFYCFGCGVKGNAIDFMMQYEKLDFKDAIIQLASYAGMQLPEDDHSAHANDLSEKYYHLMSEVARFYMHQLKASPEAIQYLKQRGLSGIIAKEFQIGFASDHWDAVLNQFGKTVEDQKNLLATGLIIEKSKGGYYDRFRHRIMFPIIDQRQRIVGFGGRVLDQSDPKYLNSPETSIFHKGKELYGLFHALKANRSPERFIVVEGYMDVIALFQHGITNAVATLGTATSAQHIQTLRRFSEEICFCFDGDAAGKRAAWRAVQVLLPMMQADWKIRFLFLPDNHDPDSFVRAYGKDQFFKILSNTTPLVDFFLNYLAENNTLVSIEDRSRYAFQVLKHTDTIRDPLCHAFFIEALAEKTRLQPHQLQSIQATKQPAAAKSQTKPNPASTEELPQFVLPLQHILSLLVQAPYLSQMIEPLNNSAFTGLDFLNELILSIQSSNVPSTAHLIELWRDNPRLHWIHFFAQKPMTLTEDKWETELQGLLSQLKRLMVEHDIQHLFKLSEVRELNPEEKNRLSQLISEKKQPHTS